MRVGVGQLSAPTRPVSYQRFKEPSSPIPLDYSKFRENGSQPPSEPYVHLVGVYGPPSLEHFLEAVLFNRAAFACPTFPAWNPRTVSLPLSDSLSSVLPLLIPTTSL